MRYLLALVLSLALTPVWADTLLCPFDVTPGPENDVLFVRTSVLNRPAILSQLRAGLSEPLWTEVEVAGVTRTTPNRLRVELPFSTLSPPLQAEILAAGCTTTLDGQANMPARSPRVINGQLDYDSIDTDRPIINPRKHGLRRQRRAAGAWPWLAQILGPHRALADPSASVLEHCNCTQDPLTGCLTTNAWGTTFIGSATATPLQADGGVCTNSTNGPGWWNNAQFGPLVEVYACWPDIGGGTANSNQLWLGIIGPGASTVDGYRVLLDNGANTLTMQRITDNTATTMGTAAAWTEADGDCFLFRRSADDTFQVEARTSAGSWAIIDTETDSTYDGTGYIGIGLCGSQNCDFENFGGGTLTGAAPSSTGGLHFFFGR